LIIFENLSFGLSEKELVQIGVFLNDLTEFDNTILVIDTSPTFEKLVQFKLDGENGFHWKEGPA
jgi:hypothetical protein